MEKVIKVRREVITKFFICPICNNLFKDATTISECLHTFCNKCISGKIIEECLRSCPVCNVDLGSHPLQKLRQDHVIQNMRGAIIIPSARAEPVATGENEPIKFEAASTSTKSEEVRPTSPPQELKWSLQSTRKDRGGSSSLDPILISDDSSDSLSKTKHDQNTQNCSDKFKPIIIRNRSKGKQPIHEQMGKKSIDEQMRRRSKGVQMQKKAIDEQAVTNEESKSNLANAVPIWFKLIASDVQEGDPPLPQIFSGSVRVKSPCLPVSMIQKYIAKKLYLASENEVEITFHGISLSSEFDIRDLMDAALEKPNKVRSFDARVGGLGDDFVLVLYYGRKAHPSK